MFVYNNNDKNLNNLLTTELFSCKKKVQPKQLNVQKKR